jgi:hypothetical protein
MGNSKIALYYDYKFEYGIRNLEQYLSGAVLKAKKNKDDKNEKDEIKPLEAFATAKFAAGVKLFGAKVDIISAQAGALVPNNEKKHGDKLLWMKVTAAGKDFFKKDIPNAIDKHVEKELKDKQLVDGKEEAMEFSGTMFEVTQRFTVGPVPMSLSIGMSGGMGIAYGPYLDLDYTMPDFGKLKNSTSDLVEKAHFAVSLGVKIRPYAYMNAYAAAAIDIWVVSAGVRADLTLIHASLPFVAAFGAGLNYSVIKDVMTQDELDREKLTNSDGNKLEEANRRPYRLTIDQFTIDFKTSLDLELRTLDGKISCFAKVDVGFWDKTFQKKIVSWKGPRFSYSLFDYNPDVYTKDLKNVQIPLYDFVVDAAELAGPALDDKLSKYKN